MGAASPRLVAPVPEGWSAVAIDRPPVAESSGAAFTEWSAARGDGDAVLLTGCVATPIPGWVEDLRPAVEARAVALVGAATAKVTGGPIDARPALAAFELRPATELTGPPIGHARTFLGFDDARVFTCFAACAPARLPAPRPATEGACGQALVAARLEGGRPPPSPGLALAGATWAVHHPREAALGAGAFVVLAGALAIALRRRPRSSIARKATDDARP